MLSNTQVAFWSDTDSAFSMNAAVPTRAIRIGFFNYISVAFFVSFMKGNAEFIPALCKVELEPRQRGRTLLHGPQMQQNCGQMLWTDLSISLTVNLILFLSRYFLILPGVSWISVVSVLEVVGEMPNQRLLLTTQTVPHEQILVFLSFLEKRSTWTSRRRKQRSHLKEGGSWSRNDHQDMRANRPGWKHQELCAQ